MPVRLSTHLHLRSELYRIGQSILDDARKNNKLMYPHNTLIHMATLTKNETTICFWDSRREAELICYYTAKWAT